MHTTRFEKVFISCCCRCSFLSSVDHFPLVSFTHVWLCWRASAVLHCRLSAFVFIWAGSFRLRCLRLAWLSFIFACSCSFPFVLPHVCLVSGPSFPFVVVHSWPSLWFWKWRFHHVHELIYKWLSWRSFSCSAGLRYWRSNLPLPLKHQ
jgi:hypothetical protein